MCPAGLWALQSHTPQFATASIDVWVQGWHSGVRALASHHCGPGSIPRLGVICGLSLLVLFSAPRGFSPGTPVFPSLKNQHFDLR